MLLKKCSPWLEGMLGTLDLDRAREGKGGEKREKAGRSVPIRQRPWEFRRKKTRIQNQEFQPCQHGERQTMSQSYTQPQLESRDHSVQDVECLCQAECAPCAAASMLCHSFSALENLTGERQQQKNKHSFSRDKSRARGT